MILALATIASSTLWSRICWATVAIWLLGTSSLSLNSAHFAGTLRQFDSRCPGEDRMEKIYQILCEFLEPARFERGRALTVGLALRALNFLWRSLMLHTTLTKQPANRWFSRHSSRFFALCWMLAVHVAFWVPLSCAMRSAAAQPAPTMNNSAAIDNEIAFEYPHIFRLGAELVPGVRLLLVTFYDEEAQRLIVIACGTVHVQSEEDLYVFTPDTSPQFFLPGLSSGAIPGLIPHELRMTRVMGVVVPAEGFDLASFDLTGDFTRITWTSEATGDHASISTLGGVTQGTEGLGRLAHACRQLDWSLFSTRIAHSGEDIIRADGGITIAVGAGLILSVVGILVTVVVKLIERSSRQQSCQDISMTQYNLCMMQTRNQYHCFPITNPQRSATCCPSSARCCADNYADNMRGCDNSSTYAPVAPGSACISCVPE